ncbi:MAG: zf-HC2 domain-containing protein [Clostridia bacterium]|nr:zf-HC2 domain-containing protein [Clostridia bacterium]
MINKKECEIVQDLLFNYSDDLLNPESKKLVENHLLECKECQNKLTQIKEDNKKYNNKEKIEIDYLKKVRIKSKIKSLLMTLAIIFIIVFVYYFIKFIKINDIIRKSEEYSKSNNYYIERIEISDGVAFGLKTYYKDGKYKEVCEVYTDAGVEKDMEIYGSKGSSERVTISYKNNTALIETGTSAEITNNANKIKTDKDKNIFEIIGKTFKTSITTDNYDIGREYYVIKDYPYYDRIETWVDKENGLPIRKITRGAYKDFFAGTKIMKKVSDRIENYSYEFGNVTDEDVKVPDLSNFEIKYSTTMGG